MKKRADAVHPRGFTLLEVVVTLTILGLVILILFGAFRLGLGAWDRGEKTKEESQQRRTAAQLIQQQIKSAVPYKIKAQKAEGDYLAFEGKGRSLKLVSALSLKAARPNGLVYAVYEFKDGGVEGGRLVAYERRVINKDFFEEGLAEDQAISVLTGLSDVRFEYFREEDKEKTKTPGWMNEWSAKEEKELPSALRVVLTFKNGKGEKEETPHTLLASIGAYQYDEKKAGPTGFGRRAIRQRFQQN